MVVELWLQGWSFWPYYSQYDPPPTLTNIEYTVSYGSEAEEYSFPKDLSSYIYIDTHTPTRTHTYIANEGWY